MRVDCSRIQLGETRREPAPVRAGDKVRTLAAPSLLLTVEQVRTGRYKATRYHHGRRYDEGERYYQVRVTTPKGLPTWVHFGRVLEHVPGNG